MRQRKRTAQTHAVLDESSRLLKARKILDLLAAAGVRLLGARVLDVGTGSGYIAAALARAVGDDGRVVAVDRASELETREGFTFIAVEGTTLPFDDGSA